MNRDDIIRMALEALEGADMIDCDMREAITALREALSAQSMGCQCPACQKTLHASDCAVHNAPAYPAGECDCGAQPYPENFIDALKYDVAWRDSEFITHSVDQPYDWSEWVCPNPKGYLMKCCDCGLVHEAEFGVVRYKSETEREDCDRVDDPNLQAVFRMRRSEQWSPKDTAHRAGGLPMEQSAQRKEPEQEPWPEEPEGHITRGVQPSTQQDRWVERWYGSTEKGWWICSGREHIAHLGTEVSSDEVRKIVDAHNLYKLSPQPKEPEQEPVAVKHMMEWVDYLKRKSDYGQHMRIPSEMSAGACWELAIELEQFINTAPPQREFVGLTDEQISDLWCKVSNTDFVTADTHVFARAIEAKLRIKNNG